MEFPKTFAFHAAANETSTNESRIFPLSAFPENEKLPSNSVTSGLNLPCSLHCSEVLHLAISIKSLGQGKN